MNIPNCSKVAVTDIGSVMVSVQLPLPVQAPPQPLSVEPLSATAVSETRLL